ncbi:MAG: cytochrome C [Anaerolineales bacterium]|nr:cytochrome C [Anaerolineae bacterium]PWB53784.1 MAG: cytochrome C [Anaerolineales bacterium]
MMAARKHLFIYLVGTVLITLVSIVFIVINVAAAPSGQVTSGISYQQGSPTGGNVSLIVSNETCLGCHGTPGISMQLENGETLDLYVDPQAYAASIHGQDGYACVQCHTNLGEYPHPEFKASDPRDATLQLTGVCDRCHSGQYTLTMDSVHAAAQAEGKREAAVCSDCHGSHNVQQWTDPDTGELLPQARLNIPLTCAQCHNAIYQKYVNSVHGAALTEEANTDVPTCIDCHGVHNIGNPTTAAFRLNSPQLCATCHTNPELMDKYGISTDVLNTYISDFHGTTVTLFEKQSPDAQTNKPVCYDCHGVHDISKVDDPNTGLQMQENLLARCKVCHPDATRNFPAAWMSHYIPSASHFPAVYYVNLFYSLFIPGVLGFMLVLVGLDVGHSVYVKTRHKGQSAKPAPESVPTEVTPPEPGADNTTEQGDQLTEEVTHG